MKKYLTLILLALVAEQASSQTLQTVTDNGNITSRSVTIGTGYTDAKLNVNAIGIDGNNSNDVTVLINNHRYNSTNSSGDNRIVLGWGNHWAAAIGAYKETANTTGLKFFTEYGYNLPYERMRISATGNVGIGTTTPAEKLSVNGNIGVIDGGSFEILSSNTAVWANSKILTRGYSTQDYSELMVPGHVANTASLRLLANGNVGIGTPSPTEKLSVNGKIRAQEIKVETANWPDFVFAKEYKLPSLQQTEKHILANGHLPGIPSAAEVAKDGVELGEMNKKLLQKVEELTLHLIRQEKLLEQQLAKSTAQEVKLNKQQNEINNLKKGRKI